MTARPWARQPNPSRRGARQHAEIQADLPEVMRRLVAAGYPPTELRPDASRLGLTRLQRQLREATEVSPQVAQDDFIQRVRKHLHRLLDH